MMDQIVNTVFLSGVGWISTALLMLSLLFLLRLWMEYRFYRFICVAKRLPLVMPAFPIFGHILYLLKNDADWSHLIVESGKTVGKSQIKNFSVWVGPYPVFGVGESEDIQTVLTFKNTKKTFHYTFLNFGMGNGLLTSSGEFHKISRRFMNVLFTPRNLQAITHVFNDLGRRLTQDLSKLVGRGHMDTSNAVGLTALHSIMYLLFGVEVETTEELIKYPKACDRIATLVYKRVTSVWLWPNFAFNLFYGRTCTKFGNESRSICDMYFKEMKARRKADEIEPPHEDFNSMDDSGSTKYINFMDAYENLRKIHPEFSEQDEWDQLRTLILTGSHTSKTVISSLLLALAAYPNVQEKLYEEVMSVVGDSDRDINAEDLDKMQYMDQVYKETLRKFVIVPFVLRVSDEDIKLRDQTVPAGMTIAISLATQLYNTDVFPDPEHFDPERFSPENEAKMQKNEFTPFAQGWGKCIGITYVSRFVKIAVAQVIRKLRFTTSVDIDRLKYILSITAHSVDGYPVEVHHRVK